MTEKNMEYTNGNEQDFKDIDNTSKDEFFEDKDQQGKINVEIDDKEQEDLNKEDENNNVEKYIVQLQRVQAEFLNYKRRTEQRMSDYENRVTSDVLSRLLPVIDDFDIYFQHHRDEYEENAKEDGIQLIYNKLLLILTEMGLEPVEAEGQSFDPELHEAVLTEETDEVEEGTVLKVWQKGFLYKGHLLRPAKVVTAKAPEEK